MFKKLPKKKRILAITGVSLIGLIILFVLSAEFTSRPKFCTTCHYMQPFYDSWVNSSHKDVSCVKCHFEPGLKSIIETKTVGLGHVVNYATKVYKKYKPTAEISDASCLRSECHDTRLLAGKEKFKSVYFDHEPHLTKLRRGKTLRCTSCHSQIVQGDHMKVTETTCFICHFKTGPGEKDISNCVLCHDPPTRENSLDEVIYDHTAVVEKNIKCEKCHTEMVAGGGDVPKEYCYTCHIEPERSDRIDEVDFLHQVHLKDHKIECQRCHTPIQHKLPEKESLELSDCSACHTNSHQAQIQLFTGSGGFNVGKSPNPMFNKSITCKGCHVFHEQEELSAIEESTSTPGKKPCESCHGTGFEKLLDQWKKVSQNKLNTIFRDYQRVEREILNSKSKNKAEAKVLLQEAKHNIDLVDLGKSVHNIQFSNELLGASHKNITKALKLVTSSLKINPFPETSKVVPSECNSCHFGIETQKQTVFGLEFSHKNHVVQRSQECKQCHSNERKHGELTISKTQCASCHHKESQENCTTCHLTQSQVYTGTIKVEGYEIEADIMSQGEVECSGCHNLESYGTITPDKKSCIDCHDDEEYGDMLSEWQDNSKTSIKNIENWFLENRKLEVSPENQKTIELVKALVKLFKTDGSEGVHNPEFFNSALETALEQLNEIKLQ